MTLQQPQTVVLIADDDDDDFFIFSMAVEELEMTVALTHVKDGENLMRELSEHIPDILFLDIDMPCKDGKQCLKEIRANQRYDHLPVIIYTSFSDLHTIDYCFQERSNLYALKPNSVSELGRTLSEILAVDWKQNMRYPSRSEFVINPS